MILADIPVNGKETKALVHFDRNGFAYTLDRETGALLVAEKFDPAVNWATHVDLETGRPAGVPRYSTQANGEDVNTTNVRPAALGTKDQQPAAFSLEERPVLRRPTTSAWTTSCTPGPYNAGQPYVGATVAMYPAPAARISATSSPSMPAPARSSGRTPSRSRSGRVPWPRRATSCSTARSRAT